jgi:monofunctional biosynthetic peptidoglycan transglycosylase
MAAAGSGGAAGGLRRGAWRHALRFVALLLLCGLALQIVFVGRIAAMAVLDPQSTTFQRSEAWRLLLAEGRIPWSQQWVPEERLSKHLMRAVVASEDAGFFEHHGIDWEAVEEAWQRNRRAEARAEAAARRQPQRAPAAKLVGGSTITQQLAKNLLLSGERTVLRKAQEALLALALEAWLPKRRILVIYLNSVEWGEGVFGAQAAARHYFRVDAAALAPWQAARLAVMLPAPKRFEKRPGSPYLQSRTATILARMGDVVLPP